jgi:hypothetical protein
MSEPASIEEGDKKPRKKAASKKSAKSAVKKAPDDEGSGGVAAPVDGTTGTAGSAEADAAVGEDTAGTQEGDGAGAPAAAEIHDADE